MTTILPRPTRPTISETAPRSVFVYGTLRPGFGNHALTVGHLPHRTMPATAYGFRLRGADWPFPYALPEVGQTAHGDLLVFERTEWPEALSAMDSLEGYPVHYDRWIVPVDVDGNRHHAWIYSPLDERRARRLAPVPGNDWLNVASPGETRR